MTSPTTTTIDPYSGVPLLQRTYHTVNNGMSPWVFAVCFVILAIAVLIMAVALSRIARSQ